MFDNFAISPVITQVLLHWGYELVENDLLYLLLFL